MEHLPDDLQRIIYSYLRLPAMVKLKRYVYFQDLFNGEVQRFKDDLTDFVQHLHLRYDLWSWRGPEPLALLKTRALVMAWSLWRDLDGYRDSYEAARCSNMTTDFPKESLRIVVHAPAFNPLLSEEASGFLNINRDAIEPIVGMRVNPFHDGKDCWQEYVRMWRFARSLPATPSKLKCQYMTCKNKTGGHKWGCYIHFRKVMMRKPRCI